MVSGRRGSTPTATAGPATNGTSGTFTGPLAANPYGDVQVQITVQGGKIVDVQALSLPIGGHSGRISNYVEPILRSQALAAQSARINGVSGASYTSQAYAAVAPRGPRPGWPLMAMPMPISSDGACDPEPRRRLRVEHIMGTAVTIDARAPFTEEAVLDAAFASVRDIDARFSLYREDSELSRLARGEIAISDLSPDVRWVLAASDDLARTSGGAFDARRHRPDGIVDPSGLVKGWAVESAAQLLVERGARNLFMAAGGDIVTRGRPSPGQGWRIGIQHPTVKGSVAAVLAMGDGAVATSGLYERGEHIVDPRTGAAPVGLLSMTVVGPDLAWADAYATAGFVMGLDGLAWVHAHPGYGALAITASSKVVWTPTIEARLIREPDTAAILI